MDYLLSKINKKPHQYYKILTNVKLFEMDYKFDKVKNYVDDYKLQDDEWFVVDDFTKQSYCLPFLRQEFIPVTLPFMKSEDYNNVDYIISVQSDIYYLFQKVTSSNVYKKRRMVSFSEEARLIDDENILVIKELPDCVFDKQVDKLYFKNLSSITSIFDGINILYREATDNEVENFLTLDILNVADGFNKENVKTANRRRIKEATEKYNNFTKEQKENIPVYISKYCPSLYDKSTDKINISNEVELANLLNVLNQRYYTTEIDGEMRLAHSVSKLKVQYQ